MKTLRTSFVIALALSSAACISMKPLPSWHVSKAVAPEAGHEMHDCAVGYGNLSTDPTGSNRGLYVCQEGYACVHGGCEWCNGDDGVETRCTNGND